MGVFVEGLKALIETLGCGEYAAAASCLKQTIEMDFNLASVEEVTRLMQGDGSGRVQR